MSGTKQARRSAKAWALRQRGGGAWQGAGIAKTR
nr:MAG TPA: hypothetical protein [Caudoviricetes sp.]